MKVYELGEGLADAMIRDLDAAVQRSHRVALAEGLAEAKRRAPVDTGDFVASLQPFGTAGPSGPLARGERPAPVSVEQALAGWQPGQPSGFASELPYSVAVGLGQGSADPHFVFDAAVEGLRRAASKGDT